VIAGVIIGGRVPLSRVKSKGAVRSPDAGELALPADPELLFDGPTDASRTVVLAHGAGAGMDSPFLAFFATGLGERGVRVVRFEFPYMAMQRSTGKKKPPDRKPVLRETWLKVVEALHRDSPDRESPGLVLGGKSMGGRVASLVADEVGAAGLVCLGYPFHPAGKPDPLRVEHLRAIQTPTLIVQGERDPFGSREEVGGYKLSPAIRVAWIGDGDHSFTPRRTSGRTERQNWACALDEITAFLESLTDGEKTKRPKKAR
jgi:predicted alpha/beta-hydrolase family hydrolase